jgi:hypothetical protein
LNKYSKIRDLVVEIDGLGPIQVYDGEIWYNYLSMELKHEALSLFVSTIDDYFTHEVLAITDVKGFRAAGDDIREKLKSRLAELKKLI